MKKIRDDDRKDLVKWGQEHVHMAKRSEDGGDRSHTVARWAGHH